MSRSPSGMPTRGTVRGRPLLAPVVVSSMIGRPLSRAEAVVRPPFRCDYGYQTSIGARTFVNWGLIALDVAPITIGEDVQIGPNVQLLTATHPLEPGPRRQKWESSKPIAIGNNVWLGGGVIVCPGVTIGENTVVGAGAVVVKDLPANVVAVGNPARILRSL